MLRQLQKSAFIVINQAPPGRGELEASATLKAREALRFVKYPVADVVLGSRLAYSRAIAKGSSVEESDPDSALVG